MTIGTSEAALQARLETAKEGRKAAKKRVKYLKKQLRKKTLADHGTFLTAGADAGPSEDTVAADMVNGQAEQGIRIPTVQDYVEAHRPVNQLPMTGGDRWQSSFWNETSRAQRIYYIWLVIDNAIAYTDKASISELINAQVRLRNRLGLPFRRRWAAHRLAEVSQFFADLSRLDES